MHITPLRRALALLLGVQPAFWMSQVDATPAFTARK